MRKYILEINGKVVTVQVRNFSGEEAELELNGETFKVKVQDVVHTAAAGGEAGDGRSVSSPVPVSAPKYPATAAVKGQILAPIPGVLLSIYVAVGDKVRSGQPLFKMEAMKMENEVSAGHDGTVRAILAQVGDSIVQGQEVMQVLEEES